MGPASGVLTILLSKGHDGIVDFHDFFVESYWRLTAINRVQVVTLRCRRTGMGRLFGQDRS